MAQARTAAPAVTTRARARGREAQSGLSSDSGYGKGGCDPRLVRGVRAASANRAQWMERLSYYGNEQMAGTALTALVVALVTVDGGSEQTAGTTAATEAKELRATAEVGRENERCEN